MDINNYKYVNVVDITEDIKLDVTKFLLQNNKQKTLEHVLAVANTNKEIPIYFASKNFKVIGKDFF